MGAWKPGFFPLPGDGVWALQGGSWETWVPSLLWEGQMWGAVPPLWGENPDTWVLWKWMGGRVGGCGASLSL